jgi:hypothetical protein
MRGQKLFNEIIKGSGLNTNARKGRNDKLVTRRNECLLARYFFYGFYKNLTYEDIVRELVMEFFIAPNTIVQIIQNNEDELQAIKHRGVVTHYFQNKWPFLKW